MKCQTQLGRVAKMTRAAQSELAARVNLTKICCYWLSEISNPAQCFFCVCGSVRRAPGMRGPKRGKMFDMCQKFTIDQSPAIGVKWRRDGFFTDVEGPGGEGLPVRKTRRHAFWDGLPGKAKKKFMLEHNNWRAGNQSASMFLRRAESFSCTRSGPRSHFFVRDNFHCCRGIGRFQSAARRFPHRLSLRGETAM